MAVEPDKNVYADSGVDTAAGDLAVELMKKSVSATHSEKVIGGVGGFAGLYDISDLKNYEQPLLASSTDGVGTKVAIAQAIDKHDTVGQDLVGMVIDDIIAVGAKPMFMTDYIACGKVVPERIAELVSGIAKACAATGTALVGGETAEHPGLLKADEYDLAGAAVGVVEADRVLGANKVGDGDVVLAIASSGLHSNGFSLVRKIIADAGLDYKANSADFGGVIGEVLLEPTRLYTAPLLNVLSDPELGLGLHSLSHVTGGGIAANLSRVLPQSAWVELDRGLWEPSPIFGVLSEIAGIKLEETESTWNLGIGMIAVVSERLSKAIISRLELLGEKVWQIGQISFSEKDLSGFETEAKGITGGAVRLVGSYR